MTPCHNCPIEPSCQKKRDNIRKEIDEMVKSAKSGALLFTDDISRAISIRKRSVTNRTVGKLMNERDDVVMKEGYGRVWVKR